jgi:SPP1 gp7 family putative phage head morphogenesis protein
MTIVDALTEAARSEINKEIAMVEDEIMRLVKAAKASSGSAWSKHPNHVLHDKIVAYYSDKIAAALKDQLKSELPAIVARAKKKYDAAKKAAGDSTNLTPAQQAAQGAMPNQPIATSKDLQNLLRGLAGDSYVAGVHAAMGQIPTAGIDKTLENLTAGVDWDSWEPGWAEAADLTKLGGWTDIMSALQYTFDGITQTNMDRIESQIAQSLASGDSVDTLSANIADMVGSDSRADLIANTETARMMSMATQDSYQAADIGKYTLLTEDDACQECLDLSDDGNTQYDIDDDEAMPPIHPNCRCAMLPVVTTSSGSDDTTDTSGDSVDADSDAS